MTTVALIFDLPDDLLNNSHGPIDGKEIIRLAVKCWIENHTPRAYSARLTRRDIIGLIAEDVMSGDNDATEALYQKILEAVEAIDRYMSHVISPHKLIDLERTRWLGGSCVVQVIQSTH